ncbi:hypothetical protein GCK32_018343 [Trichostrongylus colubriformis]|uniref:Uncharacterized protein n=1 Tax=Trichostrongylus colubriformis TaxID=6319 RepID=A0AAN8FPE7_TRICO
MIDFRKHLRSQTFAAEISLWQKFCDRGVIMTPGQHVLCPQPGWMRLVFSCSIDELTEGRPLPAETNDTCRRFEIRNHSRSVRKWLCCDGMHIVCVLFISSILFPEKSKSLQ